MRSSGVAEQKIVTSTVDRDGDVERSLLHNGPVVRRLDETTILAFLDNEPVVRVKPICIALSTFGARTHFRDDLLKDPFTRSTARQLLDRSLDGRRGLRIGLTTGQHQLAEQGKAACSAKPLSIEHLTLQRLGARLLLTR